MTKVLLATAVLLSAGLLQAQQLEKGNLVGVHTMQVDLKPGVTMEQFADFYFDKIMPVVEKNRPGWKAYRTKWIRGEKAQGIGGIFVIDSEAERDKYYNEDGSLTELGQEAAKELEPLFKELEKLGTITKDVYTDWLVQ